MKKKKFYKYLLKFTLNNMTLIINFQGNDILNYLPKLKYLLSYHRQWKHRKLKSLIFSAAVVMTPLGRRIQPP